MKRAALAGLAVAALLGCWTGPSDARTWDAESWWQRDSAWRFNTSSRKSRKHTTRTETKSGKPAEKLPPVPNGPLHIIVSIDEQRATLYADGHPVASTPISSGTASHPTPMGVFTVIQKDRHHVSNLYDAAMPYMQRITWSGSALHQGPLPGYPASHGCVRLTTEFADLLWRTTKLGARVIIARPRVTPIAFESPVLTLLNPKPAPQPQPQPMVNEPALTSSVVQTADAGNTTRVSAPQQADAKPLEAVTVGNNQTEQPTKLAGPDPGTTGQSAKITGASASPTIEAKPIQLAAPTSIIHEGKPATTPAAAVTQPVKNKPISVFVSLKEGRIYVRQGWKALFDMPISIENPTQTIGTHVYTAMGLKTDGDLRWTVVTIPSGYQRVAQASTERSGRKSRVEHVTRIVHEPVQSPADALKRLTLPPEAVERIAALMMPGSSLIVSDNKLSDETNESTDFIVLTR